MKFTALVLSSLVLAAACEAPQEVRSDDVPAPTMALRPRVATLADRPTCNLAFVGHTVHVDADNSMWVCVNALGLGGTIPHYISGQCSPELGGINAGKVAWASNEAAMYACVGGTWVRLTSF